ncbi:hypothetical protein AB0H49_34100 [Nocardia sp. NPDC050713]|uniref:hypothetical protein n=1 Tax=Nocardia sp. NPDC050713 TaxID=3154511 RepID=UPI0033F7D532
MSTPESTDHNTTPEGNAPRRRGHRKATDNVVPLNRQGVDTESEDLTFFSGGNRYRLNRKSGVIAKTSQNKDGETVRRAVLPFVPDVVDVTVDLDEDDLQDRKLYTISVDGEQSRVTHRQLLTGDVWANFSVSGHGSRGMVNVLADAVLRLAEDHPTIPLHRHTGWIEIDGRPVYLTAGSCIGADGAVPGPAIELGPRVGSYALPAPLDGDQERDAVRASLDLLNLAPAEVMWPLLLMTYLPPLELCAPRPDFLGVLYGPSDTCKSVLAGIGLSHYSPRSLLDPFPQNFSSTRVSLETYAHGAKNALQVVDDAHPASNRREQTEIVDRFEYLARSAANGSARGRGSRSGGDRKDRPPRGFALVTAELRFKVPSAENRSFIVALSKGQVDKTQLNAIGAKAEGGVYAQAMAGFIRYLAARHEAGEDSEQRKRWAELRSDLVSSGCGRSASHLAHLLLTADTLLNYAWYTGAITDEQANAMYQQAYAAVVAVDSAASAGRVEIDPVTRWVELLREAFDSKQAHLESMDGAAPEDAGNWGWEQVGGFGGGDQVRRGLMLGNLSSDGQTLYLIPKATHELLNKMAGAEGFGLDDRALNDRLGEAGVIRSKLEAGQLHRTIKTRIGNVRPRRFHISVSALENGVAPERPLSDSATGATTGAGFQASDQQESGAAPVAPVAPAKNSPHAKTGRTFIADQVAAALAEAGGDRAAAAEALVAKAIPDTMELFDATRAGARYDHTAHPIEPDILRKPAKGAANAIWEARPKWTNPCTPADAEIQPLDVNAAYLSAMTTHLPIGALQHDDSGVFDRKRSGLYEIDPVAWDHDHLPNPLGSRSAPGPVWVTRPTLQLLADLSTDRYGALCPAPVIHQSWTSGSSENLLRALKEALRDARAEAIECGDEVTETYIKAMYSKFVSTMAKASRYNHDLERTDWGHIIRAQAHANLWRRAHKAHTAGLWVHRLTGVDELHVAGDWRQVWAEGRGLGEMKPKGDTYRAGSGR